MRRPAMKKIAGERVTKFLTIWGSREGSGGGNLNSSWQPWPSSVASRPAADTSM